MRKKSGRILCTFFAVCLVFLLLPVNARAAEPEEPASDDSESMRFELWYGRMEEIVQLFRDWSSYNGVTDGNGYCTTDGKPFGISTGDKCYIGSVTAAMKRKGFINYTVPGGWSCNGFVRFSMHALYGRTFWRDQMTENVFTLSLFSKVDNVKDFLDGAQARIGDMLCIMGYADFDGDGKINDEYWHYMMFIRYTDEGVLVMDGNFDHQNGVQIHLATWEFLMGRQWIYLYHMSDKDYSYIDSVEKIVDPARYCGSGRWQLTYK